MQALLEEQYQSTEDFANAQSRLFNNASTTNLLAHQDNNPILSSHHQNNNNNNDNHHSTASAAAIHHWMACRDRARSNVADIQSQIQSIIIDEASSSSSSTKKQYYEHHLSLSSRVLESISAHPSWHANGIPESSGTSILETNTVALASLKASIARITELEGWR